MNLGSAILFLALIAIANSTVVSNVDQFDYLILRQIWPESSCMFVRTPNQCSINADVSTWVVHGLWPTQNDHPMEPTFCDKANEFDFSKIKWLLPRLERYWPNLYNNTPLDSFWKHEWDKHGTCTLGMPQIKDESDYFNVSLALRDHYDFGVILKANNIEPSDDEADGGYDYESIKHSIKSVLNVDPFLVCFLDKKANKQYISQMQVCLDKQFELIECKSQSVDMIQLTKATSIRTASFRSKQSMMFEMTKTASSNVNNDVIEIPCHENLKIFYPKIKHLF